MLQSVAAAGAQLGAVTASGAKDAEAAIAGLGKTARDVFAVFTGVSLSHVFVDLAEHIKAAVVEMAKLGMESKVQEESFSKFTASIGVAGGELATQLKKASGDIVSTSDVLLTSIQLLQQGLQPQQIVHLMEVARAQSKAAGMDIVSTFNQIGTSIANQNERGLRAVRMNIDMTTAMERAAEAAGKNAQQMTEVGKAQVFYNEVVTAGQRSIDAFSSSQDTQSEILQRMAGAWKDMRAEAGKAIDDAGFAVLAWGKSLLATFPEIIESVKRLGEIWQQVFGQMSATGSPILHLLNEALVPALKLAAVAVAAFGVGWLAMLNVIAGPTAFFGSLIDDIANKKFRGAWARATAEANVATAEARVRLAEAAEAMGKLGEAAPPTAKSMEDVGNAADMGANKLANVNAQFREMPGAMDKARDAMAPIAQALANLAQQPGLAALGTPDKDIVGAMAPMLNAIEAVRLKLLDLRKELSPEHFAAVLGAFDAGTPALEAFARAQAVATVEAKNLKAAEDEVATAAAKATSTTVFAPGAVQDLLDAAGIWSALALAIDAVRVAEEHGADADKTLADSFAATLVALQAMSDRFGAASEEVQILQGRLDAMATTKTLRDTADESAAAWEFVLDPMLKATAALGDYNTALGLVEQQAASTGQSVGETLAQKITLTEEALKKLTAEFGADSEAANQMRANLANLELDTLGAALQKITDDAALLGTSLSDTLAAKIAVTNKAILEAARLFGVDSEAVRTLQADLAGLKTDQFAADLQQVALMAGALGSAFDATGATISVFQKHLADLAATSHGELTPEMLDLGAAIRGLMDQQKIEQWLSALTDGFGQMLEMAQKTAQAFTTAFSDFFFDAFTGNVQSLTQLWHSFLNSMLRALSDFLAQSIVKEFVAFMLGAGGGGGILAGIGGWLSAIVGGGGGGGGGGGAGAGASSSTGGADILGMANNIPTGLINPGLWTSLSTGWEVFNTGLEGGASLMGALNSGFSAFQTSLGATTSVFGTLLPVLGAAVSAFTLFSSLAKGTITPLSGALAGAGLGASTGAIVGTIFPGIGNVLGAAVGALIGAAGGALLGLFGKPKLTHEQREAIEFSRTATNLTPLVNDITTRVRTWDQLFNKLVEWSSMQSSGGQHEQQVVFKVGTAVIAAPGSRSAGEPGAITSSAGLRQALLADPHALQAFVQQGIAQPMLDKLNEGIKAAVDAAIDLINQLDTVQNTVFPKLKQAVQFSLPAGPMQDAAQHALDVWQKEFIDTINSSMTDEEVSKAFDKLQAKLTTFGNYVTLIAQLQADAATITGNLAEQTRIGIQAIQMALSDADRAITDAQAKLGTAQGPDAQIAAGEEVRQAILARYALEKSLIQQIEANIANLLTSFGNHIMQMQIALDVSQLVRTGNGTAIVGLISGLQVMATTAMSLSARLWAVSAGMSALIAAMEGLLRLNNMGMGGTIVGGGAGRTIGDILPDLFTAAQPFLDSLQTIAGMQLDMGDLTGALETLQKFDATAQQAADAALNMIEEWRKASIDAIQAQLQADIDAINAKHNLEIQNATAWAKVLIDADNAAIKAIQATAKAQQDAIAAQIAGIQAAAKAEQDAIAVQIEGLQAQAQLIQETAQAQQQAIADQISGLRVQQEAVQKAIAGAREWESAIEGMKKFILDLKLSPQAPLNPAAQLAMAQGNLDKLLAEFRAHPTAALAAQIQEASTSVLNAGALVFSRPSPQYQALFASIVNALGEVQAIAQDNVPVSSADLQKTSDAITASIETLQTQSDTIGKDAQLQAKEIQRRIKALQDASKVISDVAAAQVTALQTTSQSIADSAAAQVTALQDNITAINTSRDAYIEASNAARDAEVLEAKTAATDQITAINNVADDMSEGIKAWLSTILTGSATTQSGILQELTDSQGAQLTQLTDGAFSLAAIKTAAEAANLKIETLGGTIGGGFKDYIGGEGGVIHQTAATATESFHTNQKLDEWMLNEYPSSMSYLGSWLGGIVRNTGGGGPGWAKGLWDVPYSGMYKLHPGEMVLPRQQAVAVREGRGLAASGMQDSGGGVTATFAPTIHVAGGTSDAAEIRAMVERELRNAQRRWEQDLRYGNLGQALRERK